MDKYTKLSPKNIQYNGKHSNSSKANERLSLGLRCLNKNIAENCSTTPTLDLMKYVFCSIFLHHSKPKQTKYNFPLKNQY